MGISQALSPIIRSTSTDGFSYNFNCGRSQNETETICRRANHFNSKRAGSDARVQDLVRRYNVSEQSIYRWKAKYGGMEVSDARWLKELESENSKLKRLLADSMLENAALKELGEKKW